MTKPFEQVVTTVITGPRRWLGAVFPFLLAGLLLATLNRDDGAGAVTAGILVAGALIVLGLRMISRDRLELTNTDIVLHHAVWGIAFSKRWERSEVSSAAYDGRRLLIGTRDGRRYRMPTRLHLQPGPLAD
jgi:hypothetical protein